MLIRSFPPTAKRDARLAAMLVLSIGAHLFAFGHLGQLFQPETAPSMQAGSAPWTAQPSPGHLLVHLEMPAAPVALREPNAPEASANLGTADQVAAEPVGAPASVKSSNKATTSVSLASAPGTTDQGADSSLQSFLKPSQVDLATHPLNAPNVNDLGPPESLVGQSVRLRIYVDSQGHVAHIDALPASNAEPDVISKIEQAVSATQFIPAVLANEPVASYTVVDLSVGSLQVLSSDRLIR